ncbi:hypothetical protein [Chitinophaga sp. 212800010-3]|uniref:hypothetical protein n=1 Tax=unclassified Chitinophaga TaxID=2619133 RepID=UPI002DE9F872|nr:hypothetical protein [Chitinophaga sp. 212800010-3]
MKLTREVVLDLLMQKAAGVISEKDEAIVDELISSDTEVAALWAEQLERMQRNMSKGYFTPKSRADGWQEVISTVKNRRKDRKFLLIIILIAAILTALLFCWIICKN